MHAQSDKNGDGALDEDEFLQFMAKSAMAAADEEKIVNSFAIMA